MKVRSVAASLALGLSGMMFVACGADAPPLLAPSAASASATVNEPTSDAIVLPVPAPAPEADINSNSQVSMKETDSSSDAVICMFDSEGDYVHVSATALEASGHGWWINRSCRATLAVVTVQLQQYYSDGIWRNVGTVGQQTVTSGGGTGNRATGRASCPTRDRTGWRSLIDVDVVGILDGPGWKVTAAQNIDCRW